MDGSEDEPFNEEALAEIKGALVQELRDRAVTGELFNEVPPKGAVNYFRWKDWDEEADLIIAIKDGLAKPHIAAKLLASFISTRSSTSGSGIVHATRYVQISGLENDIKHYIDQWIATNLAELEMDEEDKAVWNEYLISGPDPDGF
jgi:hypothetical protein